MCHHSLFIADEIKKLICILRSKSHDLNEKTPKRDKGIFCSYVEMILSVFYGFPKDFVVDRSVFGDALDHFDSGDDADDCKRVVSFWYSVLLVSVLDQNSVSAFYDLACLCQGFVLNAYEDDKEKDATEHHKELECSVCDKKLDKDGEDDSAPTTG